MTALTVTESARLAEVEATIERGLSTFVEVGRALVEVRDARLYRADYGTFEDYCAERWNLSRRRAYDLITSASTVESLSAIAHTPLPANEGQARELTGLAPDVAARVMREAHEDSPRPTAATIRQARERLAPKADPAEAADLVQRYPDLGHYADQGRTRDVVRLGRALDSYDEPERATRVDTLRKSIAADKRRDETPEPPPGPDFVALTNAIFDACNRASRAITTNGGATTVSEAVHLADHVEAGNWHDEFAHLATRCAQLAQACKPARLIRSVK